MLTANNFSPGIDVSFLKALCDVFWSLFFATGTWNSSCSREESGSSRKEGREWDIAGIRCVDVIVGTCFHFLSEEERMLSRSEGGEENTGSLRRKEEYEKLTRQAAGET